MAAEGQSDKMVSDMKMHMIFDTEQSWRPNSGCEHGEAVGGVFQQWRQQQWVTSASTDFDDDSMQALVHCW